MKIFGHRGAAGLVAENTLASIAEALIHPIDGIEIDVHCCKSGELVVIHDETLARTTNGIGDIADCTLEQLKQFTTKEGFLIPTLAEVLQFVNGRCTLNIELKGKKTALPTLDLIEQYIQQRDWEFHDFILSSFDHSQLFDIQKKTTKFKLGVLTEENSKAVLSTAHNLEAYSIHPPVASLTKDDVMQIHDHGFKLYVWTVNKESSIRRLKKWNVDAIITDFPNFA
ncbi:glycerophosphodiester phosphodiesterase [Aquimarina sp. U1-2]|uniref:glycerophosphodiester phosphodiesterase n=1 Tax=Aquimarina sp. U1-2 TaxID=2823141 RepID=UPI001AECA2AF|nr:glycerophosphodiester phosphodiesterase family protein [Aquimarina sp. U1-2]MBP2831751.1 glycerophosphodiester phosphodiesterase [Aquimarina sp. U1-2]